MRARTNISLKDRKSLTLSDFKGVDFSSSPLRVKNNRATSMRNFINEYGVNKKRNGWNEVLKFEGSQINGIFQFGDDIIVYAGTKFYKVAESDGVYSKIEITTPPGVELQPNRIQAFFNKGKAYIIGCGDYLVYGSWDDGDTYELRRVADVAYIPTTTISIDNASIADNARATLDDINCLSSKRINQLVGVSEKVLELQEAIKSDSAVTIMLNSQKTETETETETETGTETETETETGTETETEITTITNKVTETFNGESYTTYSEYLYNGSGDTKKVWGRIDFAKGKILVPYTNFLEGFSSSSKITVMYNTDKSKEFEVESSFTWTLDASIDESTLVEITLETLEGKDAVSYTITNASDASTYGKNLYKVKKNGENFTSELCGTLDWGKQTQNAKINLTCSTVTQIENRDNIFVKFYHTNSGYEDRITKCTFGTLFGVEGNTDRLFFL